MASGDAGEARLAKTFVHPGPAASQKRQMDTSLESPAQVNEAFLANQPKAEEQVSHEQRAEESATVSGAPRPGRASISSASVVEPSAEASTPFVKNRSTKP